MSTAHNLLILAGVGLFVLLIAGVLAAMLAWPHPALAQQPDDLPKLIISPTELHVGEGESVTYTVLFDKNPEGFVGVECGEVVYVNMRGFDIAELSVAPSVPEFRTGDSNCKGGNWNSTRTIRVGPQDHDWEPRETVIISHAVWDNGVGTLLEEEDAPKVRVTVYDNDPTGAWVSIEPGTSSTEGSNVTFTLRRGENDENGLPAPMPDLTQPLTVNVSLSETGSMLSGSRPASVEFAANSDTATLEVETTDDNVDENNSVIKATSRAPSGHVISGRPWATVEARNNDFARLRLTVDPASIAEDGSLAERRSTVTVSIINDVTFAENQTITLDFSSSGDTPAVMDDYTVGAETLTLRAGQTQVSTTVTAVDDPDYELAETIEVSAIHGSRTIGPATITIEASDPDAPQPAWSATLTVGEGMGNTLLGYDNMIGTLSPNRFDLDGDTYTVTVLRTETTGTGTLLFLGTNTGLPTSFVLELGGQQFHTNDATGSLDLPTWADPGLTWSDMQSVDVKLNVFDPMLSRVRMEEVIDTTANAIVETVNANGSVVYLRYRSGSEGSTSWSNPNLSMITVMPGMTSVTFSLTSLTDTTVYEVQASLESTFVAEFADAPASEKTTFTAGTPPPQPPPPPPRPRPPPGPPPVVEDSCVIDLGTLTGAVSRTGAWADDCDSANRSGSYARFYSFTLAQETAVTIDLTSDEDAYLFLLQGSGSGGTVEEENDNIVSENTNSQIVATLAASTYTIEATTNLAGATGSFTITVENILSVNVSRATGSENALVRPGSPVSLTATFSRPVFGFAVDDITVVHGAAENFAGSDGDAVYTLEVTPNAIGEVTVDIPAGAAEDAGGNGNKAAPRFSLGIPYDDDGDGMIDKAEVIEAINDYLFGEGDAAISKSDVIKLINLYLFG